ncbi:DUF6228 family protein [Streptomyces collinus]|uniref:DUF6228 family protein n=1 Tax=Streptomyces collinus TaxID=42684 RepID=UPI0036A73574
MRHATRRILSAASRRVSPRATGGWSASATTWLEAGEQMTALAAGIRRFPSEEDQ